MTISLGLDIGSNSVGSAWVDTEERQLALGVSIFPAGVDETDTKRGKPKNQARRMKRSQRRSIERRGDRKHRLRKLLTTVGLLPDDPSALTRLMDGNPWNLRRDGLLRALTPHEFGRVLVHLNQRRGALGINLDDEHEAEEGKKDASKKNPTTDEGKVTAGIGHTRAEMKKRSAVTFGQMMSVLHDERRHPTGNNGKCFHDAIRNRRDSFEFHAERGLIRDEFNKLWDKQKSFGGELAKLLTDDLKKKLDDPIEDDTWRYHGEIFGQRRTYWDTGTLGRCDLEPTDHRCPIADMYAQEFRVLETVNNLRVTERSKDKRPLQDEERAKVIAALRQQKTAKLTTVKKALGVKKTNEAFYSFSMEDKDPDRDINTDWFYCAIIHGVFTEYLWHRMTDAQRDAVNRAILKFDPDKQEHETRLHEGGVKWWGLSAESADKLVAAWKTRPKLERRVNFSRRAIQNLLPNLRKGLSVTEARQAYADDLDSGATPEQRARYAFTVTKKICELLAHEVGESYATELFQRRGLTKKDRHFLRKHPDLLPPAPMLANPVVRKAIHEVRRHVLAYLRKFRHKPDRVVIELARESKQTERVRNEILSRNRQREKERKQILEQFNLEQLSVNQQRESVQRVLLCRQQRGVCPYSDLDKDEGRCITERMSADGTDVEVDHIVPLSRSQDNGLNNKVLCFRKANRNKGNKTVKEWLSSSPGSFERIEQRFAQWKTEWPRKWENLNRDAPTLEDFARSQLTDTAYAATQVGEYLKNALFGGESDGKRKVFFTKGLYTAMLRNDWGLNETRLDHEWHGNATQEPGPNEERGPARKGKKDRTDHRHHAIDAVVIALTDADTVERVAHDAAWQSECKDRTGNTPRRPAIAPPWDAVERFRGQVLDAVRGLAVFHRPVKRKVTGYLHKEDMWGAVDESEGVFRIRCSVSELNPKMLRMPVEESDTEVKKRLLETLRGGGLSEKETRKRSREMFQNSQFTRRLIDPSLGKGGLVRDWNLRSIIRECLQANGIDPDTVTDKQMKEFAATGKLRMPSGVPIKSVITIGPISDPVKIAVKDHVTGRQAVNSRTGRPVFRFHISRNNHHVEIVQDEASGDWCARDGKCVTMIEAAGRNAARLSALRNAGVPTTKRLRKMPKDVRKNEMQRWTPKIKEISDRFPVVDRRARDGKLFVMSLSDGEMIHARRPDRDDADPSAVGYFVVTKLDKSRIWFGPHWDAREEKEQDRWDISYADLKRCEPEPGKRPYKVRVSPLGEVTPLHND